MSESTQNALFTKLYRFYANPLMYAIFRTHLGFVGDTRTSVCVGDACASVFVGDARTSVFAGDARTSVFVGDARASVLSLDARDIVIQRAFSWELLASRNIQLFKKCHFIDHRSPCPPPPHTLPPRKPHIRKLLVANFFVLTAPRNSRVEALND